MAWDPISRVVPQYVDGNGDPYSGAVLKFYAAGTSTNISAATDNTGGTLVTSIALNAQGFPEVTGNVIIPHLDQAFKIALYATQAAADSDTGAIWNPDNISIGAPTAEWQDSGVTPTFATTTTFTLSGDQTDAFHIGRRLKTEDSGGTDYSTITNSVYADPTTTVTVSIDSSGVLDAGLSTVQLSILRADNVASPIATATSIGAVELATQAEVDTGTDATRVVTPETLAGGRGTPQLQAEVATTSGTTVELSGSVPAWVKRITVLLSGVSTDGTSKLVIQIGDSGGYETTGYTSEAFTQGGTGSTASVGFAVTSASAAGDATRGRYVLELADSANNTWIGAGMVIRDAGGNGAWGAGEKSLSAALDRIRLTTPGGDTFDAGAAALILE